MIKHHFQGQIQSYLLGSILTLFYAVVGAWMSETAQAAEKIQFSYGPVEATVYVDDLAAFTETGELSDRLRSSTRRLSPEQLSSLRSFLGFRSDVSPIMMSQFAYSPIGEPLIQRFGQVIQTDSLNNGFSAIRSGLISASMEEGGLTTVNFLQKFPLKVIQVDLPSTLQLLEENRAIYQQRDTVLEQLRQIAIAQSNRAGLTSGIDLAQPGSYRWRVESFPFQNPRRAEASEVAMADLYLPEFPSSLQRNAPIIVISHGVASNRQTLSYLAVHFASHGYAVIVPAHVDTTTAKFSRFFNGLEGAPAAESLLYRPVDITTGLNLLEERAQQDPELQALDFETVGVLGQSLGGFTALTAAGAELNNQVELEQICSQNIDAPTQLNLSVLLQCRLLEIAPEEFSPVADSRVKAAISINPLSRYILGKAGLSTLDKPTFIIAGLDDYFTPAIPEQIQPFEWIGTDEKYLLTMEKGTHFSLLGRENESVFPIPAALLGPEPEAAQALFKTMALAFFNYHLQGQQEAQAYLDQSYIESLDLEPFRFAILRETALLQ